MTRPFYLIGHNTNTIGEVRAGLRAGLNAFEIDVNRDAGDVLYVTHDFVSEPPPRAPHVKPPTLDSFLKALRELAVSPEGAGIALVVLDIKVKGAAHGLRIVNAVRTHLSENGTLLPVIYSVPELESAATCFAAVHATLGAREGLMIDEEAKVANVVRFFTGLGVPRGCYGNGITTLAGIGLPSPKLIVQMDGAVAFRAIAGLRFAYAWVLVETDTMREFLRIGVDGVMVDTPNAGRLVQALASDEFRTHYHAATRADDPFAADHCPLLQVLTKDAAQAGTDARLTFTVELTGGRQVRKSVNAAFSGRFERGSRDFVLLNGEAFRLDEVLSVTVSHDGSGNAPDWFLATITLRRRGEADRVLRFEQEIGAGVPVRRAFG